MEPKNTKRNDKYHLRMFGINAVFHSVVLLVGTKATSRTFYAESV